MVRIAHDPETRAYFERRIKEGRTKRDIILAWVRLPLAERRATRNTRMASTFPSLVLADPVASLPWAARAAATVSWGSDFPLRRRRWRLGRSTSTTVT